jgi:hypothetical protein
MSSVKFPPTSDKWGLRSIRGDARDESRIDVFTDNELLLQVMEPRVQAAYQDDKVVRNIMIGGIRQMFAPGSPAAALFELHLMSHGDDTWSAVLAHMKELFAGSVYQSKQCEELYALPPFDAAKHGSSFDYYSKLLTKSRDAGVTGEKLVNLCISKAGDGPHRVHIQSILDMPTVNKDVGRLLLTLQSERRSKALKHCSVHGANTSHDDAGCRQQRNRPAPYTRPRPNKESPRAQPQPPARGCPADMSDRPENCWTCGLPGHPARKCSYRQVIFNSADPATERRRLAAEHVASGRPLRQQAGPPTGVSSVVTAATPAATPTNPPPVPPRPERLGSASVSAIGTTPPVLHEAMAVDTDVAPSPLTSAMSDLIIL